MAHNCGNTLFDKTIVFLNSQPIPLFYAETAITPEFQLFGYHVRALAKWPSWRVARMLPECLQVSSAPEKERGQGHPPPLFWILDV